MEHLCFPEHGRSANLRQKVQKVGCSEVFPVVRDLSVPGTLLEAPSGADCNHSLNRNAMHKCKYSFLTCPSERCNLEKKDNLLLYAAAALETQLCEAIELSPINHCNLKLRAPKMLGAAPLKMGVGFKHSDLSFKRVFLLLGEAE